MSANSNPTAEREALRDVLERYGSSLESFLGLRPDSYEQNLARHSLEHLDLLYTELLKPQTLAQAREKCPPWPPETKRAGRLPSEAVLSEIAERLRTEATLNSLGRVSQFLERIRSRAKPLPVGQQTEVLDTIVTLVGEEMIAAKLSGGPLSENLDPLDRLLVREDQKRKERERADKWAVYQEKLKSDIEKALESFYQFIKPHPQLIEAYEQFKAAVEKATAAR